MPPRRPWRRRSWSCWPRRIPRRRKSRSTSSRKRSSTPTTASECHDGDPDGKAYANSVHGQNSCTSCHRDIIDLEKHAEGVYHPRKVDCTVCHKEQGAEYENSIHKLDLGFDCTACHDNIHTMGAWDHKKAGIVEKCTQCHAKEDYVEGGHAAAVLQGNEDAAVCSDCHGLHNTRRLHANMEKYPEEARVFYNRTCMKCHGDKEMMKRNGITTSAVDTYEETYHGKIQKLGYPTHVAGCADCHASHKILPKDDPSSTINPANLIKNCSKCHEHVNANFVKFRPHADFTNRKDYPLLFWTVFLMTGLLIGTFLFFWIHTALWWRKSYWENQRLKASGVVIDPAVMEVDNPGEYVTRFRLPYRLMHVTLISTFFGLVFTGMPLSSTPRRGRKPSSARSAARRWPDSFTARWPRSSLRFSRWRSSFPSASCSGDRKANACATGFSRPTRCFSARRIGRISGP
ncbi:MAG: hypothetical protein M5R36_07640 [Deltaproteobacteria bacterium]|nr:hypothetical protein [Deltaproteobacteria bacterium]